MQRAMQRAMEGNKGQCKGPIQRDVEGGTTSPGSREEVGRGEVVEEDEIEIESEIEDGDEQMERES